jgi:excisionase family DNA binding protein
MPKTDLGRRFVADYLKIPEVAQLLGLSEKTVRRRVKAGEIPSVFVGGVYRISRAGLEEYLEKAKVSPGKAPAPPSSQLTLNGELEETRRAEWDAAVRNARQLRQHGRGRLEGLLSSWHESRERGESSAARRGYLAEIGELLDEAYNAEMALKSALTDRLDLVDLDEFAELQAADRFYVELFNLVQRAELSIRTDGAQEEEAAHAGQAAAHAVEESEAA